MMRKSLLLYLLVVFAAAAMMAPAAFAAEEKAAPVEAPKIPGVGDMIPEFSLPTLDGKTVTSKDISGGKPISVVIFMSTACSACQAEIAAVDQILGKYGDMVDMFLVSVDIRGADTVKPYSETYKYKATYLLDTKFTVPRKFGFSATPSVVVVDKSGKILLKKAGYQVGDEEAIQEAVIKFAK